MAFPSGTRLGAFEVISQLGAGGMGEVYLANDTRLGRMVALKVLAPHLLGDQRARERFEREARVIAALNHPHVCTVHDVGHSDGHMFLVLEHLQGETLAARLSDSRAGPLRLDDALSYGTQIAEALHAAHVAGIVHRDLKPGNVMLTSGGVKLLDFGIARTRPPEPAAEASLPTKAASDLTEAGTILGTLNYMAPEQLDGRPVDARSDIFALGAVLYELFTGRRAFDVVGSANLISAILRDDPGPFPVYPSSHGLNLKGLEPVVQRCLAKAPDERWQSAKDVAHLLRGVLNEDVRSEIPEDTTPSRPRRWPRFVASIAAVGVSGALGLLAWRGGGTPPSSTAGVLRTQINPGISAAYRTGSVPSLSHNGRKLALTTGSGISILDLTSGAVIPLSTSGEFRAWSPDDRTVIFRSNLGTYQVAELGDGGVVRIGEIPAPPSGGTTCLTWIGNDIVAGTRGPLMRTSVGKQASWQPASTLDEANGETGHPCAQVLPDGHHILFSARYGDSAATRLFIGEFGSSARTQLLTGDVANFQFVSPRWLLYGVGTTLVAQDFDPDRREIRGAPVTIASDVGRDPLGVLHFSASDTGLVVAQSAGSVTQLQWFDRSGAPGRAEVTGDFESLTLSDDRRLAAMHGRGSDGNMDIWTFEFDRGVLNRVSTSPLFESFPVWARDGSAIVFSRWTDTGSQIVETNADGSGERVLLDAPTRWFLVDDLDRDRNVVIENFGARGGPDLFLLRSATRVAEVLLQTPFHEEDALVSPDGRWLAYQSDQSGRTEVYVQPFGRQGRRVQVSTVGGGTPRWRRDGRELYFVGSEGTITAVQVAAIGQSLAFSAATPLFQVDLLGTGGQQYDVSPDGQSFLVNVVKASPLHLIVNWPALLTTR